MIQAFIQVAAGSCDRNIYNERTLEYLETRPGSLPYPYPYGFIVGTSAEDGCCVDCYLITNEKLTPGTIVECEPVALLEQHEDEEIDHKILAVLPGQELTVHEDVLKEIEDFIYTAFAPYLEIKLHVGPSHSREAALAHIQASREA